jgi:putative transposase
VIDCCTREIVGWNLSDRCRTEEALVEKAVLERLPAGSRETDLTLTTDNGASWRRLRSSASHIAARLITIRKETATSNGFIAA